MDVGVLKELGERLSTLGFTLTSIGVEALFVYQMVVAYGEAFPLEPYNLTFTVEIPMIYKGLVPLRLNPFLTFIPLGVVVAMLATWMYTMRRMAGAPVKLKQPRGKPSRFSVSLLRWKPRLGFSVSPSTKSGVLVLGIFTTTLFIPYIITSPLVYPSVRAVHQMLPDPVRVATYQFYAGYVKPLRMLDPVSKFLLSQNLSVLITVVLSYILTRTRY